MNNAAIAAHTAHTHRAHVSHVSRHRHNSPVVNLTFPDPSIHSHHHSHHSHSRKHDHSHAAVAPAAPQNVPNLVENPHNDAAPAHHRHLPAIRAARHPHAHHAADAQNHAHIQNPPPVPPQAPN